VTVVDGADWHKSKAFEMPVNLKLLFLSPYCPELNPQEHIWDELRAKCLHNKTFDSLEDHLVASLKAMETQNETAKSIRAWDWIINAFSIGNWYCTTPPIEGVIFYRVALYSKQFKKFRSAIKLKDKKRILSTST
jgi:hypothetical protein